MQDWCGFLIDFKLEECTVLLNEEYKRKVAPGDFLRIETRDPSAPLFIRVRDIEWITQDKLRHIYDVRLDHISELKRKRELKGEPSDFPYMVAKGMIIPISTEVITPTERATVVSPSEKDFKTLFQHVQNEKSNFRLERYPQIGIDLSIEKGGGAIIIGSFQEDISAIVANLLDMTTEFASSGDDRVFVMFPNEQATDLIRSSLSGKDIETKEFYVDDFADLCTNGFGYNFAERKEILQDASSFLSPPEVRMFSDLLGKEGQDPEKLMTALGEANERLRGFIESKWKSSLLEIYNKVVYLVGLPQAKKKSKEEVFSMFLNAVKEETIRRKRSDSPPLSTLILVQDIEEYVPTEGFGKDVAYGVKSLSREAFKESLFSIRNQTRFVFTTTSPSMVDRSVHFLCDTRIFGKVWGSELRELEDIKKIYGIERFEIDKLPSTKEKIGVLIYKGEFSIPIFNAYLERKLKK